MFDLVLVCMRYFALRGVIERFFLFQLSHESKQYFMKFANEMLNSELWKEVKVLPYKQ